MYVMYTIKQCGSRGDPRVPWIPPFRLSLAYENRTLSNLPEVQQSLPVSALVLSVQSSYKLSLKHLKPGTAAMAGSTKCTKSGHVTIKVGMVLNFSRIYTTWVLPSGSSKSTTVKLYALGQIAPRNCTLLAPCS